jgi:cytochrome P450
MGLLETLFEHLTVKSVSIVSATSLTLWVVISRVDEHRRIRRLGNYGPTVHLYWPLGLDFIYRSIKATLNHDNLEHWRKNVFMAVGSWTCETRIANQRVVFTADPENIKAILATQFGDYGKGEPFHGEWKDFLGDSIFTTDGAQWHASRQLIRPQFTRDRVSDLHCFEAHMQTLFRAIANGAPLSHEDQYVDMDSVNGKVFNISELFFRYTLDVTTDFLLGSDVKSLTTPKQEFADAFNEVQRVQNIVIRASKLQGLIPKSSFWAGLKVMNSFVGQYIQRALGMDPAELLEKSKSNEKYTFLDELAGFTRDPKVLRDQIVAILLAGRDTTASTLSWVMYEISRRPEIVAKLRQEILEVVGADATPTFENLKNMPYLKAVLNETLRLYPVVPFNVRLALHDTTLPYGGGKDGSEPLPVLKDTPIGYSTLVMQRRPELYPPVSETFADPAVFSPERWATWHPKPHHYIPFNAGPRICIGQQFALTEMSYVLVRLFQRYDRVESYMHEIDGGNPMLQADITLSPGQGVNIAFWEAKR